MADLSTTTSPKTLNCPLCGSGVLHPVGRESARCDTCSSLIGGPTLKTLLDIASLPDATGNHACECGHPEMRRLPDGVYWCPACGSEVVPVSASKVSWKSPDHSEAYWSGWLDGRYRSQELFTRNRSLMKWENAPERLEYYRGHRAGYEARLRKTSLLEAS
ncbi:MAG TPA: hypothetical protein VFJ72_02345 [Rubrobacteraceae bacterium]|nr:hypothetical protein [Rubrobacteraceae bacterium]